MLINVYFVRGIVDVFEISISSPTLEGVGGGMVLDTYHGY